jgi:dipeptidyl aminopeptidase/acylaminoacyl peptidase
MAGAPVANMFSAYGGIRWKSGLSRQFQYERTQSRIGSSIWDDPELYVENSPLFGLPKVKTPLLIMHNDGDGSVPWYQGIELFMGLRRLNKPVWLLNYNGDDHNLMKEPNRIDLSIRMRQFFDYYLNNKPAPSWLIDGIPAIDKGKATGYELIGKP